MTKPIYQRVMLKISGEALLGKKQFGIDHETVSRVAFDIGEIVSLGVKVGLVIGGGNIFRGVAIESTGGDRVTGDHLGMLATVMNALSLRSALEVTGISARVMSNVPMPAICETFTYDQGRRYYDGGKVVIFAGGTGNPYFTTDTAAALKAAEMGCDALLKGTKVDGIYSSDPESHPEAVRYERINAGEVIKKDLKVMDMAAFALARENHIPVAIFSIFTPGELKRIVTGNGHASIIDFV